LIEKVKYICEHCKREYFTKENAIKHEKICWRNKTNKTCHTCQFYKGIMPINTGWGYEGHEDIVCCGSEDTEPDSFIEVNCPHWQEDKRTNKQRLKDRFNK
jgi:hypothetical protein